MMQHFSIESKAQVLMSNEDRVHAYSVLQIFYWKCGEHCCVKLIAGYHHILVVYAQQVALQHFFL